MAAPVGRQTTAVIGRVHQNAPAGTKYAIYDLHEALSLSFPEVRLCGLFAGILEPHERRSSAFSLYTLTTYLTF